MMAVDSHRVKAAVDLLAGRLAAYRRAWETHPDYAQCQALCPHPDPVAVAVYVHRPCLGNRLAYMVGPLTDLVGRKARAWGEAHLGIFSEICPVPPEMPVDPYRLLYVGASPVGKGHGFLVRSQLKALLPKRFHRLVTFARQEARMRKQDRVAEGWDPALLKDEINFRAFCRKYPEDLAAVRLYITPEALWACAMGRVEPDAVAGLVVHQLSLPLEGAGR